MDQFNPKKPKWDTSLPGPLPDDLAAAVANSRKIAAQHTKMLEELENLTPDERLMRVEGEALSLANSQGQSLMSAEQNFIYAWERERTLSSACLDAALDYEHRVDDREAKIEHYRQRLAMAFLKLGHLDAAKAVASACASPTELQEHIARIEQAEANDEDLEDHKCPRPKAEIEYQGKPVWIDLNRRWDTEVVMSSRYRKLVHIWQCSVCGELNASPDTPVRQQQDQANWQAIDREFKAGRSVARWDAAITLKAK